jgi:hypothetical protein
MEIVDDHQCIATYNDVFVDVVSCMACTCTDARTYLAWYLLLVL